MADNWIQKAVGPKSRGKLHANLGVPQGQKIPAKKIAKAATQGGVIGKEARLAKTLGSLRKEIEDE